VVERRLLDVHFGCNTSQLVADTPSIVLVQKFTYRDAPEEWSNRYHFTGTAPVDDTGWHDLAVALFTLVKPCLPASNSLVRAYGYLSDTTDSVATIDFTVAPLSPIAGTATVSGNVAPGDAAMTCRWLTPDRTSKGKPIYLRKYFHGVLLNTADTDQVAGAQHTALQAFAAAAIVDWGSTSSQLCDKNGNVPTNPSASIWATTRTLKRRGRRPPS
jgi:hypothetical protein